MSCGQEEPVEEENEPFLPQIPLRDLLSPWGKPEACSTEGSWHSLCSSGQERQRVQSGLEAVAPLLSAPPNGYPSQSWRMPGLLKATTRFVIIGARPKTGKAMKSEEAQKYWLGGYC